MVVFRILVFSFWLTGYAAIARAVEKPDTSSVPHAAAYELLEQWCGALMRCQIPCVDARLDGGILCPACGRIHGRCVDAVLPFMLMADRGGVEGKNYLDAAKRVMRWGRNVKRYDGAWMNDINVSSWDGTTVFAAIALYEALAHHGRLLDDSTRRAWTEDLASAGAFIYDSDFIYSRRRGGWRNMNINYSASGIYALYAIGKMLGREDYMAKARRSAGDMADFFTPEGFLYGEGPDLSPTPKGCLPVDLAYNVEESLPNLAAYAYLSGDSSMLSIIGRSLSTHLEFMLPDGAWDNSWGTRSFKWTYWGGRTTDGCAAGYYLAGADDPAYTEAVVRNTELLASATRDGMLYGGMGYRENGIPPCIHHTMSHAKSLAAMLDLPRREYRRAALPRDSAYGVKYFRDINTWLVGEGGFRATVTDYDAEYKVRGTHPMGGALSMLWHTGRGPLFAASVNTYSMIEPPNMQADMQRIRMCATPRVEVVVEGVMYSNLDDTGSSVVQSVDGGSVFDVRASLVDLNRSHPPTGREEVSIRYLFREGSVVISAHPASSAGKAGELKMVLPLIASRGDRVDAAGNKIEVFSAGSTVTLTTDGEFEILPSNDGRIVAMSPGFGFIPVSVTLTAGRETSVEITVR